MRITKKSLSITVTLLIVLTGAEVSAATYKSRCFHVGADDYKSCQVFLGKDTFRVTYKSDEYRNEDVEISGRSIIKINSSYRGTATPVDKPRQQYTLENSSGGLTTIRIRIEDAPEFQQQLTQLSRRYVTFSDPQTTSYDARCLHPELDDYKSCILAFNGPVLETTFDKLEESPLTSYTVSGNRVTSVASGNYARRLLTDTGGLVGTILLGPAVSVSRLAFSKEFQQYVLEFTDEAGQETAVAIRLKRSQAPEFQQALIQATGKFINFQGPELNTAIDVGRDIK